MSWRNHEAEESEDEYRRNFKATNKDGSPGPSIINKKPFWVFYWTASALESKWLELKVTWLFRTALYYR